MINDIYQYLIDSYTLTGCLLVLAALVLFCIQLYYYMGVFTVIPMFRNNRDVKVALAESPAVSIVVVIRGDLGYVKDYLPILLKQRYDVFEVVVVDMSSDADTSDVLQNMTLLYPHLKVTKLVQQQQRFPITNKMALNVGIKTSSYDKVVFTTTETVVNSDQWLAFMARGFIAGDVVIGYCGIEEGRGLSNKLMRCNRLLMSVRYLSSAIRGYTYRGISHNMGYTKDLYFKHKGFDHLNMDCGDDDLFIQKISQGIHTSIVLNPHATVRQRVYGDVGRWISMLVRSEETFRYYPLRAKRFIECEITSRFLFFASTIALIVCMPLEIAIGAAVLLFLRMIIVEFEIWRICRRLGERGLMLSYILYDLLAVFVNLPMSVIRRFGHRKNRWS